MKCPNCGYEHQLDSISSGKKYREAVEERLEQYGFSKGMYPKKHTAATAVKQVISIKTGIHVKSGGGMSEKDAHDAILALDEVLPMKGNE